MLVVAARRGIHDGIIGRLVAMRSGLPGMPYSHVEFYWSADARAFVIHPEARTGDLLGMAWLERTYEEGQWDFYFPPITPGESTAIRTLCDLALRAGGGYDWPGIVEIATLGLRGKEQPKWWFCSEFIADCFRRLGYVEAFPLKPSAYTPALACYAVKQWSLQPDSVRGLWRELASRRRAG